MAVLPLLFSQELSVQSRSALDWQNGTLNVTIIASATGTEQLRPDFLHRAQQQIDEEFPAALFNALLPQRVNSLSIVEDAVRARPVLASQIADLAARSTPGLPRPFPDFSGMEREFSVPIFPDFVSLFIDHEIPFRMEEVISWVPTTQFSGVVIYAGDPLPLRGTTQMVYAVPALLPEIYDEDFRPVLEQDMLNPDAVRRWGVVAYTGDTSEDPWYQRVGANPLRIMAREVYGIHPTDLIIGREDADRLLADPRNRELLRNGRILVILDERRIRTE